MVSLLNKSGEKYVSEVGTNLITLKQRLLVVLTVVIMSVGALDSRIVSSVASASSKSGSVHPGRSAVQFVDGAVASLDAARGIIRLAGRDDSFQISSDTGYFFDGSYYSADAISDELPHYLTSSTEVVLAVRDGTTVMTVFDRKPLLPPLVVWRARVRTLLNGAKGELYGTATSVFNQVLPMDVERQDALVDAFIQAQWNLEAFSRLVRGDAEEWLMPSLDDHARVRRMVIAPEGATEPKVRSIAVNRASAAKLDLIHDLTGLVDRTMTYAEKRTARDLADSLAGKARAILYNALQPYLLNPYVVQPVSFGNGDAVKAHHRVVEEEIRSVLHGDSGLIAVAWDGAKSKELRIALSERVAVLVGREIDRVQPEIVRAVVDSLAIQIRNRSVALDEAARQVFFGERGTKGSVSRLELLLSQRDELHDGILMQREVAAQRAGAASSQRDEARTASERAGQYAAKAAGLVNEVADLTDHAKILAVQVMTAESREETLARQSYAWFEDAQALFEDSWRDYRQDWEDVLTGGLLPRRPKDSGQAYKKARRILQRRQINFDGTARDWANASWGGEGRGRGSERGAKQRSKWVRASMQWYSKILADASAGIVEIEKEFTGLGGDERILGLADSFADELASHRKFLDKQANSVARVLGEAEQFASRMNGQVPPWEMASQDKGKLYAVAAEVVAAIEDRLGEAKDAYAAVAKAKEVTALAANAASKQMAGAYAAYGSASESLPRMKNGLRVAGEVLDRLGTGLYKAGSSSTYEALAKDYSTLQGRSNAFDAQVAKDAISAIRKRMDQSRIESMEAVAYESAAVEALESARGAVAEIEALLGRARKSEALARNGVFYPVEVVITAPRGVRGKVAKPFVFTGKKSRVAAPDFLDLRVTDYEWDFGDGEGDSGPEVWYPYADEGRYLVTLRAYNEYGVWAVSTVTVETR